MHELALLKLMLLELAECSDQTKSIVAKHAALVTDPVENAQAHIDFYDIASGLGTIDSARSVPDDDAGIDAAARAAFERLGRPSAKHLQVPADCEGKREYVRRFAPARWQVLAHHFADAGARKKFLVALDSSFRTLACNAVTRFLDPAIPAENWRMNLDVPHEIVAPLFRQWQRDRAGVHGFLTDVFGHWMKAGKGGIDLTSPLSTHRRRVLIRQAVPKLGWSEAAHLDMLMETGALPIYRRDPKLPDASNKARESAHRCHLLDLVRKDIATVRKLGAPATLEPDTESRAAAETQ